MPQINSGNRITSSNQIADRVIKWNNIESNTITYGEINSNAVNTAELTDGQVFNVDINAAADIADTKLAQISTAGKVSGAALTSLASIPAGAGVIPRANVDTIVVKNGTTTKDAADASGTQNIAHGLGATPKYVRITAIAETNAVGNGEDILRMALSVYNGTTQSSLSFYNQGSTGSEAEISTNFTLNLTNSGSTDTQTGVITVDGTNIIITWTKTGSPTGTYTLLWEAIA